MCVCVCVGRCRWSPAPVKSRLRSLRCSVRVWIHRVSSRIILHFLSVSETSQQQSHTHTRSDCSFDLISLMFCVCNSSRAAAAHPVSSLPLLTSLQSSPAAGLQLSELQKACSALEMRRVAPSFLSNGLELGELTEAMEQLCSLAHCYQHNQLHSSSEEDDDWQILTLESQSTARFSPAQLCSRHVLIENYGMWAHWTSPRGELERFRERWRIEICRTDEMRCVCLSQINRRNVIKCVCKNGCCY